MWGVNRPARDSLAHDVPRKRCYIDANIAAQGSQVGTEQKNDFALLTVQPRTDDSVHCGDSQLGCPNAGRRKKAVAMPWNQPNLPIRARRTAEGGPPHTKHDQIQLLYFDRSAGFGELLLNGLGLFL